MTRQEFMHSLGEKLSEEMAPQEVQSELQYYRGYIDGELHRGKSEEEILADLGDPSLIAKTILESPRETTIFGTPVVADAQDAYEEGNYQGSNSLSREEVKENAEEDTFAGELKRRVAEEKVRAAEAKAKMTGGKKDAGAGSDIYSAEKNESGSSDAPEKVSGSHEKQDVFHDESGNFNWGLFAVILAAVMIITAIIWLIGKVVMALGPTLLIILAIILIVYTIYINSGKRDDGEASYSNGKKDDSGVS